VVRLLPQMVEQVVMAESTVQAVAAVVHVLLGLFPEREAPVLTDVLLLCVTITFKLCLRVALVFWDLQAAEVAVRKRLLRL
jgi:hypothetical protein